MTAEDLLSFLLHGLVEQRQTVADEFLTDDHRASQHPGRGLDGRVPHGLVDQHPHVLHGQAAGQDGLRVERRAKNVRNYKEN